ncbi:two-component sensor histidine kinase [Alicyclobacillus acidoterrestris]|nr:two-component sensor histidine kinase [Alicyclobacillus acidoterrestris]
MRRRDNQRTDKRRRQRLRQDGQAIERQVTNQATTHRIRDTWRIVFRVFLIWVVVFVAFSLAYWITNWFYHRLGREPGPYWTHMTMVGVAIALILLTGFIMARFAVPRQQAFWQSLTDAIRQMAKGDFNVRIDVGQMGGPGEFRQLVNSLNNMAQELAQVEQMRQEFISNVSHEIQSPLTAILGFVEALKSEAVTPENRQHYLNVIETESKRMSRLSENLLKLTSLESGAHPFHSESFRLDRQIRDVVLTLEPLWLKKGIEIELSLKTTNVFADKDLLNQVWMNLLTNAIKFTERGGAIFISLGPEEGWTAVYVRDTGMGIRAEEQQRVFERFYKADKARQRTESGSGLGLTIVKKIIDLHQGEIRVESQYGSGTTFIVRLPRLS